MLFHNYSMDFPFDKLLYGRITQNYKLSIKNFTDDQWWHSCIAQLKCIMLKRETSSQRLEI